MQPHSIPHPAVLPASPVLASTSNPVILWHLLSLDAPTVAALWLWFAARTTHTHLAPALVPAMFFAVWMLYIADRLLDAARPAAGQPLALRHHFHQRHRIAFFYLLAGSACVLSLLLTHLHLAPAYLLLGALLVLWLAAVHTVGSAAILPKELVTGTIFAAAIWIPELPHHGLSAMLFALLCTLNCVAIDTWEGPQSSHRVTRLLGRFLPWLLGALSLAALAHTPVAIALGLAAAGLLVLHLLRRRMPPPLLRALADAALLSPLLLLRVGPL